ncbi:hypothetical protein PDESU_03642 [Pontiella desulfatans]|uniref:Uncharacterized protein n=1 Tax=Pontiella desulfatans TaxID=2750659 RepID=A0A6C2U4S8_PONDE|nr:hypothetical protein [Pontiella desulfatans]VGO15062.1 hypothetical protein PDESU_03642 [Pontiella desulfatans]
MNQTKVNQIISYIKVQDEFPFDVFDVEDQESVLGYFGFHPRLDDEERKIIQAELMKMAEAAQTAEMARIMCAEPVPQRLYRRKYCTRMEQSVSAKEWLKTLPEELRGSLASQV